MKTGLYVIGASNGNLYTMDRIDGSVSTPVVTGSDITGIAFYKTTLYGITSTEFLTINPLTGVTTVIGALGIQGASKLSTISGDLYCLATPPNTGTGLYKIDSSNGSCTLIGLLAPSPAAVSIPSCLAFDENSNLFGTLTGYNIHKKQTSVSLQNISITTGNITTYNKGGVGFNSISGLQFFDSNLYGVTKDGKLITIDAGTGIGRLIGGYNSQNLDLRDVTSY